LVFGLVPVTFTFLYHFPVAVFWTGRVLELAGDGIGNAYTSGIAIAFAAGGVGLLGLWIALVSRLLGRTVTHRLVHAGVLVAVVIGIMLMVFLPLSGAWWSDYYLVGAPLLVAIHCGYSIARANKPQLESAAT
jgi:hypothetical protein